MTCVKPAVRPYLHNALVTEASYRLGMETFGNTLDQVAALRPDRIAVYSYGEAVALFVVKKDFALTATALCAMSKVRRPTLHSISIDTRIQRGMHMAHVIPETPPDFDQTRVIERPDGFYWQPKSGGREYGPFVTLLKAVEDMQQGEEALFEPGETAEEAKSEIGIADWIDPDTGEPAEEDSTRTEQH